MSARMAASVAARVVTVICLSLTFHFPVARAADPGSEIDALLRRAEAFQVIGHQGDAMTDLSTALKLAERLGDARRICAVTGSLGSARLLAGLHGQARQALELSLKIARNDGYADLEATTLINLGNLLAAEESPNDALAAYAAAADRAAAVGLPAIAARAALNSARILLAEDAQDRAVAQLAGAREAVGRMSRGRDQAAELVALGVLLRDAGARQDPGGRLGALAYDAFRQAHAIAAELGDLRLQSQALGHLGNLYEVRGRFDEAWRLTQQAMFALQTTNAPEVLYQWQWQNARLLAARGDEEAAIAAYHSAIATLESVQRDLISMDPGSGAALFRSTVGRLFIEFTTLLLHRAEASTGRPAAMDYLRAAQNTMEDLKSAELRDYFQDDCVSRVRQPADPLEAMGPHTAALYPIILPDRLVLLLNLPDGLTHRSVSVDADKLAGAVRVFRGDLELAAEAAVQEHGQQLYEWLVAPVEELLRAHRVDTLLFVPDGVLRSVPLAALYDGERYLVSRYAIATVPGLSLVAPARPAQNGIRPLLAGLTKPVQNFPPLPHVDEELRAIQAAYGGTILKDEAFVRTEVEDALASVPYSVVHLASHAVFAGNRKDTFLLTYDGRIDMDQLSRLVRLGQRRDEPIELLTLSACETARGDDRAALGLAGIAVKAGARSALASLWAIDDEAAAKLVTDFYLNLGNPALSKAEALRRAQLGMLESDRFRHPMFWSPFLLIGNWQ